MEMLVVAGIVLVLAAILVPAYSAFVNRSNQVVAMTNLRNIASAFSTYTSQNNDRFPLEDAPGSDSWAAAVAPENEKVWYNALPRAIGQRGVADFAASPRAYYTKENILFLPGARYPVDSKLSQPLFAFAMNSRLQRKTVKAQKEETRVSEIAEPSRTVLFFEQGLKGEKKRGGVGVQGNFDGAPKGSARSFVARYNRRGVVAFCDGHAELFSPEELVTETGALPFPPTNVIWSLNPETNPN